MEINNQLNSLETLRSRIYNYFGNRSDFVILERFTTVSHSFTDEFAFAIVDENLQCIYLLADVVSTIDEQGLIARARRIPTVYGYLFVNEESHFALDGEYKKIPEGNLFSEINPIDFESNIRSLRENGGLNGLIKDFRKSACGRYGLTTERAKQLIPNSLFTRIVKKSVQPKRINGGERVYRYLSNEAFFRIIDSPDKNQKTLTYGLSSICSMNDRWEYSYGTTPSGNLHYFRDSSVQDTHIMSLSMVNPCDSLDMWRFYGDDAKGICLEFEVMPGAPVFRVKYLNDYQGFPYFPFYINYSGQWYAFPFTIHSPQWLYSQKSKKYSIEKEARLILINGSRNILPKAATSSQTVRLKSGKWINSSGTPFPLLMMEECSKGNNLYQAPLILKRVFIGPNASDQALKKAMIIRRLSELSVNATAEIVEDFGYKPTK